MSVHLRTALASILAAIAIAAPGCDAETGPPPAMSAQDMAAVALELGFNPAARSLHSAPSFPDGAKGYIRIAMPGRRTVSGDPAFTKIYDEYLHQDYCYSNAVVLAEAEGSTTTINSAKSGIYTRTKFKVKQTLKQTGFLHAGSRLTIVHEGGEVWDAGERLRIDSGTKYQAGDLHLLFVKRLASTSADYVSMEASAAVHDEKLQNYHWPGFKDGASLSTAVAELRRIATLSPCSK